MSTTGRMWRLLATSLGTLSCGQPLWTPTPWSPFETAPGAALGTVWSDVRARPRESLIINVPRGEPFADSALVRDFRRFAVAVQLHREDSLTAIRASFPKYYLVVDLRPEAAADAAARSRAHGDTADTLGRVFTLLFERCRGWPCHSQSTVSVRKVNGRFLPGKALGGWVE